MLLLTLCSGPIGSACACMSCQSCVCEHLLWHSPLCKDELRISSCHHPERDGKHIYRCEDALLSVEPPRYMLRLGGGGGGGVGPKQKSKDGARR